MRLAITGFTGSFGRAFLKSSFERYPDATIVGLSRDEVKQGEVMQRWPDQPGEPGARLRCFLGDVRDRDRLEQAFSGCEVVVHAAALKRVDQGAYNVAEQVYTNILGTMNVVRAATTCGVKKVVVLSTDKVPEAVNSYGASKAMAEAYAVQANAFSWPKHTAVVAVRYGNVWGSRGSVLESWRGRLAEGRPLPLTDSGCTRFWMSLGEAVELVHTAIERAKPGEVFIPDLPAVDMLSVAIALGGPNVEVLETGLRSGGEKMHEVMATAEQMERATIQHWGPDLFWQLYAIQPDPCSWGTSELSQPTAKDVERAAVRWRRHGLRSDLVRRLSVAEIQQRCA